MRPAGTASRTERAVHQRVPSAPPPHVISTVWSSWPEFHARQIRRRGCAVRVPPFLHAGEAGGGDALGGDADRSAVGDFFLDFFLLGGGGGNKSVTAARLASFLKTAEKP